MIFYGNKMIDAVIDFDEGILVGNNLTESVRLEMFWKLDQGLLYSSTSYKFTSKQKYLFSKFLEVLQIEIKNLNDIYRRIKIREVGNIMVGGDGIQLNQFKICDYQ